MKTIDKKYVSVHYSKYLQLDKILSAQHLRSVEIGKPAHDEMLFIIVHQVYELWFKQINYELYSIIDDLNVPFVPEEKLLHIVQRQERIIEILKLAVQQIHLLETMTPLDFLEFRNLLLPASGFQSFQFREFEVLLGLREGDRLTYKSDARYLSEFSPEQQAHLEKLESEGHTLFDAIERWLERTPFLQTESFSFVEHYRKAAHAMFDEEIANIRSCETLSPEQKQQRIGMLETTRTYIEQVLDPHHYEQLRQKKIMRLSYEAVIAALFIHLYREEPLLQLPYRLLSRLMDIDELLTLWRYRHAQMVLRMIGRKVGTGGSSGYDYLVQTVQHNQVFADFHNLATMLIPRSQVPPLPDAVKRKLGFHYFNGDNAEASRL